MSRILKNSSRKRAQPYQSLESTRTSSAKQTVELPRHVASSPGCSSSSSSATVRLSGGENDPAKRKVTFIGIDCDLKAPGIDYLLAATPTYTSFEAKLDVKVSQKPNAYKECGYFQKRIVPRSNSKGTQSLYRESSAQTLPYLVEISNQRDEDLELMSLPQLQPNIQPPGLYEVEQLERARKRESFNQAVKTNFEQRQPDERELALKTKYKDLHVAFGWEQWIEREEDLQLSQDARLAHVIDKFEKREKQMHELSEKRIEAVCERVQKRSQVELRKNELEYQRGMRRLKAKCEKTTLHWVKEKPVQALGNRSSEYYAPLLRHGVDAARQHCATERKQMKFDMHIEELDKRIKMNNLECPYAKLGRMAQPKTKEHCKKITRTEAQLKDLYLSLKEHGERSKVKVVPKCLKKKKAVAYSHVVRVEKPKPELLQPALESERVSELPLGDTADGCSMFRKKQQFFENTFVVQEVRERIQDRRQCDLDYYMNLFEGKTYASIMEQLLDESQRLEQLHKLRQLATMAQTERCRREAAEAGLRQKENALRTLYEELTQQSHVFGHEIAEDYVKDIFTTDVRHIAEEQALEEVLVLTKKVDIDVQRWLESFKLIQTPLNYKALRSALRDMVCPDFEKLVLLYEKKVIAEYIIEDVLFEKIWQALEPYDISFTITSDLIDRLIDNDLYFFSTDSEDDELGKSGLEARAIVRKLIRQAVPGRRWKTELERIAYENYIDLLDDVFNEIVFKLEAPMTPMTPRSLHSVKELAAIGMSSSLKDSAETDDTGSMDFDLTDSIKKKVLNLVVRPDIDKITKDLQSDDVYQTVASFDVADRLLNKQTFRSPSMHNETFCLQESKESEDLHDENICKKLVKKEEHLTDEIVVESEELLLTQSTRMLKVKIAEQEVTAEEQIARDSLRIPMIGIGIENENYKEVVAARLKTVMKKIAEEKEKRNKDEEKNEEQTDDAIVDKDDEKYTNKQQQQQCSDYKDDATNNAKVDEMIKTNRDDAKIQKNDN